MSGAPWPAWYEIRVDGELDDRWSDWFEGMQIEINTGQTVISGSLPDRSALYGVLDKLRDLGLSVVAANRILPEVGRGEG